MSAALPYYLALRPAEQAFDRALGDGAYAIATIIRALPPERVQIDSQAEGAIRSDSLDTILFAVYGPAGNLLVGDPALKSRAMAGDGSAPRVYNDIVQDEPIRVFAMRSPCALALCEIVISETVHKRNALRRGALLAAVLPEFLLGLFIVFFVFTGVRRALAPLQGYTSRLLQMGELGWRELDPGEAVLEVRPLISALNRSASQLRTAAESQQRFLSTAAHQLRTPLAGLKAAADLARLTKDPEQIRAQLAQVSGSADRVARLASQLLALARAEPQVQKSDERKPCELNELAEDLMEDALRLAGQGEIDLGFELDPAPVLGHALLIRELMANLLDNALRYTPKGGRVTLRTGVQRRNESDLHGSHAAFVEVEDDGPGIPSAVHQQVFERFYRLPGTPGQGSGLGLAIVREICETHEASLTLQAFRPDDAQRPGLRIRVEFPLP